jgi:hypothetical protein
MKLKLKKVIIQSIIETVLFYILLVVFGNQLLSNPYSISSFTIFVFIGTISYIVFFHFNEKLLKL